MTCRFFGIALVLALTTQTEGGVVIEQLGGSGSMWFGESPRYDNVGSGQTFTISTNSARVDWIEIQLYNSGTVNQGVPPGSASDVLHIDIRSLSAGNLGSVRDSATTNGFSTPLGWDPPYSWSTYSEVVRFEFTARPLLEPGKYFFGAYNTASTQYGVRWDFTGNPYADGEGWTLRNNSWDVHPSHGNGDMWFRVGLTEVVIQDPPVIPEPSTLIIWSVLATFGITVGWQRRRKRRAF